MRILVVCQYYDPEPFRVTDICRELVARGHEVRVVTGTPNYPEGKVYPGYDHGNRVDETLDGVRVHRCFTVPRKTGPVWRLLNYYSYVVSASRYIKHCRASDGKPYDVVLVNQLSPVLMAEAALAYKKKYGVPVLLYCLDLWPESLIAGGISRGGAIYRFFHRQSEKIYKAVDRILVTSRMFTDYFRQEFDIAPEKLEYLPQYAEEQFVPSRQEEKKDGLDLVFAGNIGEHQSVDTILEAALQLKRLPVRWHIVGGGSALRRLQQQAKELGLEKVQFHGRLPLEQMPRIYAMADAMLVTLRADPVLSLTLPGKVQSCMAAGKPILAAINGETVRVIEQAKCGFTAPAEDAHGLANGVRQFMDCRDKQTLGDNARAYYQAHFARSKCMDKLEQALKNLL